MMKKHHIVVKHFQNKSIPEQNHKKNTLPMGSRSM